MAYKQNHEIAVCVVSGDNLRVRDMVQNNLRLVEDKQVDKSKALDAALSQIERTFGPRGVTVSIAFPAQPGKAAA